MPSPYYPFMSRAKEAKKQRSKKELKNKITPDLRLELRPLASSHFSSQQRLNRPAANAVQ